jgi:hypothetical protein
MKRTEPNNDEDPQGAVGRLFRKKDHSTSQSQQPRWAPQSSFRKSERINAQDTPAENQPRIIPTLQPEPAPPVREAPAPIQGNANVQSGKASRSDQRNWLATFWTIASVLSLTINLILILALVLVGRELFTLKSMLGTNLLGGLYENFIFMDQSHIMTNISVADTIPINFKLPISQDTTVMLTEDTRINGAMVRLNSGGVSINSVANITLPAGTSLPIHLELTVPVNTTVPIRINVPVDIPLDKTDLHKPFIGLQQVISPFYTLMQPQIKRPEDLPLCQSFSILCAAYFK